ncbi:MAG: toast rack family protein [Caldilineales bacterium]
MTTTDSAPEMESRLPQSRWNNPRSMRLIRWLSWVITAVFLIALVAAVYQTVVNGSPLPLWAWLGIIALLAVVVGLIAAAVVYRGMATRPEVIDPGAGVASRGEIQSLSLLKEADGAKTLAATLHMTQGVLRLSGGATGIADADFTYDDGGWLAPAIEYAVDDAGQGNLTITQKAAKQTRMHQGRCEWTVRLNPDFATELNIQFGAGQAELALAGLNLPFVQVQAGVGEVVVDLRGGWLHSSEMLFKAGVGDMVLRLPETTGVRLRSAVGLGSSHVAGLTREGDVYSNDLYGQTEAALDIVMQGGVGKVTVV